MSDITVSISQTDPLITSVTVVEDDFPIQVGYDDNDVIPGPTGPAGQDGEDGEPGPPGGDATLAEVLAMGNDADGLKIENLGNPSNPGDAVNKNHFDVQVAAAINQEASTRNAADINEANARTAADNALQAQITIVANTSATNSSNISTLISDIQAEILARTDGDSALESEIDLIYDEWKSNAGNLHSHWYTGEAVETGQAVILGTDLLLYVYNPANPAHVGKLIGLAGATADPSVEIKVFQFGFSVFPTEIFTAGNIYYINPATGALTDSVPGTSPFYKVGYAVSDNAMFIHFDEILLPSSAVSWEDIEDIPSTFPPDSHTHTKSEISDAGNAFIDRRGGNYYRRSGRWYLPSDNATALTATAHSSPSVFFVPFVLQKETVFNAMAVEVTGAGSVGSNLTFGIYNGDATTCEPTTLVAGTDSGLISAASTGVKTFNFSSPVTLAPGLYFTAFSTSSVASHAMRSLSTNSFSTVIGQNSAGGANQGTYINGTRASFGALPANANTLTALNATVGVIYGSWLRVN